MKKRHTFGQTEESGNSSKGEISNKKIGFLLTSLLHVSKRGSTHCRSCLNINKNEPKMGVGSHSTTRNPKTFTFFHLQ